ncbi:MAG: signal peptidase I [bacterium]|nr:signal peptidase I [bacterium]
MNEKSDFEVEELVREEKHEGGMLPFLWEVVKFVFLAVIIVVPIRVFIAQPYIVSGSSMVPTFESGDYLIVDQLSYRFENPKRGDVVVFRYPRDPSKFFIKRVIALPHETIDIQKGVVTIKNEGHPEGIHIEEAYNKSLFNATITKTLDEEEYFVMGDNRDASLDSRSWGALSQKLIVGRAFLRLFPVTNISYLPGFVSYQ